MPDAPFDTDDKPLDRPPESARGQEVFVISFPCNRLFAVPMLDRRHGRRLFEIHEIPDPKMSSEHFMFTRDAEGTLYITNLGSRKGTSVNCVLLVPGRPMALRDGYTVRIGGVVMVYREHFMGGNAPEPPILVPGNKPGDPPIAIVGPWGLWAARRDFERILRQQPRTVLIHGESGSGKELIARGLAQGRGRRLTSVNIAAVPAGTFESQVFGHVKGAFSGAVQAAPGVFLESDGGALFLDEIGELPLALQPKLLRVVEYGEVMQVGATVNKYVDVQLITATHRDLEAMVQRGEFREDLFARLSIAYIELPPLRDRPEDIYPIFASIAARRGVPYDVSQVEAEAVERLMLHEWRKNVRELEGVVSQVAGFQSPPALSRWAVDKVLGPLPPRVQLAAGGVLTRDAVERALAAAGGNVSAAARALGIPRSTLQRRMAEWELG